MKEQLYKKLSEYFWEKDIIFHEISSGRTNTNFFIEVWKEEYFLRTSTTKIVDKDFGWKLQKEKKIYEALAHTWAVPKLVYFYSWDDIEYMILEKLEWFLPENFSENLNSIKCLLQDFQSQDISSYGFLDTYNIFSDFEALIQDRVSKVTNSDDRKILEKMTKYLFEQEWWFEQELCLCHNDFRSDNIIVTSSWAKMIDLEGCIISDTYIDPAEYYIWWVFWWCFWDETEYNFERFSKYMTNMWYRDKEKQKYVFVMKFCTNYAWLAAHMSQEKNPLEIYKLTYRRNKEYYNTCIKNFLDSLT